MVDKALVYQGTDSGQPGTHVLIIGIGEYPYLLGGSHANAQVSGGMGQLTAPPISAREMAKWFLTEFQNTEKPLASLALVLSEPSATNSAASFVHAHANQPANELPRGTADEVAGAIENWVQRASKNTQNQTIFFFCGHGVSTGESILLLRDFGERGLLARFAGALNLNDFTSAMQTMVPDYQLFLIDACRVPTSIARSVLGKAHVGRSPLDPLDIDMRGGMPAKQSIHHSSSQLTLSHGRRNGTSLYTDALLQALDGGGAQRDLDSWVGTIGLQQALAAYTRRLAVKANVEQVPELLKSLPFKIHKPRQILVPLYVTSAPREALSNARLEACRQGNIIGYFDPGEHQPVDEWVVLLPVREYTISATFRSPSEFEDEPPLEVMVFPPEAPHRFEFRRKP
jgi:hypothetical protein